MSHPPFSQEHARSDYYQPSAEILRELEHQRLRDAHHYPISHQNDPYQSPPSLPRPGQEAPRTPSRSKSGNHPQRGPRSSSGSYKQPPAPKTPTKGDRVLYHPYSRLDTPGSSMDIDRSPRKGGPNNSNLLPAFAPTPDLLPSHVATPSSAEFEIETQRDEMTYIVALRDEEIRLLQERFHEHDAALTMLVNQLQRHSSAGRFEPHPTPKPILLNGSGPSVPSRPSSPVKPSGWSQFANPAELDKTATSFQTRWAEVKDIFSRLAPAEVTPDEHYRKTGDAEPILQTRNSLVGRASGRPRNPYVELPLDHIIIPGGALPKVIDVHVHASEKGIGFGFGTQFLRWKFKNDPAVPVGEVIFPVWSEVIAVEMGLRALFAYLQGNHCAAEAVRIWSDNLTVVGALGRLTNTPFVDVNKDLYPLRHSSRYLSDKGGKTFPHVDRLCKWMRDHHLKAAIGWIPSKFNIANGTSKGTAPRGHQRLPSSPTMPQELENILEVWGQ